MKKRRSTEDQVDGVMREAKLGVKIEEFCREHDISIAELANWVQQNEALKPSEARRMKQLDEENRRLRTLVADLTLSNQALKLAMAKSGES
jgi:putative transposase